MKKFLEELRESSRNYTGEIPDNTHAMELNRELRRKYTSLVGKRALYTCKSIKDTRVVTIEKAYTNFVKLSYNYYGMDYRGKINVCVSYASLTSGDDVLGDIE